MERMVCPRGLLIPVLLLFAFTAYPGTVWSVSPEYRLSKGQTVYVPVYSNVFSGPKKLPFHLATTLSIRNTDLTNPLKVEHSSR